MSGTIKACIPIYTWRFKILPGDWRTLLKLSELFEKENWETQKDGNSWYVSERDKRPSIKART